MIESAPAIVAFTRHAERRAVERGLDLRVIAELLLSRHDQRRRNAGQAAWLIRAAGMRIAYNWPNDGDLMTALVVSVWRE
jgi:hypothetical protein